MAAGPSADAQDPLMTIIGDYNQNVIKPTDGEGLMLVGRAAHLLRSARDANDAYNQAEKAGKPQVEAHLYRANLFLEKYDPGHAEEVVKEALKVAPHNAAAHVAMAHVKLDQALDFEAAENEIKEALTVDPKINGAFFVAAGLALRTMDLGRADGMIDRGLSTNPNDLDLLSMKAAVRFLSDDRAGFEKTKQTVFAKNAEYSRFYQIVGEFADWEHRYDEIVAMMREATKIDPADAKAWADLGLNLIRAGDEPAGLTALQRARQGPLQCARFQHAEPLRKGDRHLLRDGGGNPFSHSLSQRREAHFDALCAGDAQRSVVFDDQTLRLYAEQADLHRALRIQAELQRSNERTAQRRHSRRVLRQNTRRHEPARRTIQLGQRAVARAGSRVRHPALEKPRSSLVHRGAQRIRNDRAQAGVAARGRSFALCRSRGGQDPAARQIQPGVHPRRRRARRHDRLLRRQPNPSLCRNRFRDEQDHRDAPPVGRGQAHGGRDPAGARDSAGGA